MPYFANFTFVERLILQKNMAIIISWYIVLIDKINTKEIRFGEPGLAIGFRHRNESANLGKTCIFGILSLSLPPC